MSHEGLLEIALLGRPGHCEAEEFLAGSHSRVINDFCSAVSGTVRPRVAEISDQA